MPLMPHLILLNKPYQVLSQFSDNEGRDTLAKYINEKQVYPAGRLDYDSEGLLLLTNDGTLQHRIANPKHKLPKTYWVQVEGDISEEAIEALRRGVCLKDGKTRPAQVKPIPEPILWPRTPPVRFRASIPTHWLEITITEGRNRQVRRMTAAVKLPTLRLVRVRIGEWALDDLLPGQSRKLTVHMPATGSDRPPKHKHPSKKRSFGTKRTYRKKP